MKRKRKSPKRAAARTKDTGISRKACVDYEKALTLYNQNPSKENCKRMVDAMLVWEYTGGSLFVATMNSPTGINRKCAQNVSSKEHSVIPLYLDLEKKNMLSLVAFTNLKEATRKTGIDVASSSLRELYNLMKASDNIEGVCLNLNGPSAYYIPKELLDILYKNSAVVSE